jgi:hypothetical protein
MFIIVTQGVESKFHAKDEGRYVEKTNAKSTAAGDSRIPVVRTSAHNVVATPARLRIR